MIPIGDENPPRTKPYVVYVLIAINVLVFLYSMGGRLGDYSMIPYSVIHDVRVEPVFSRYGQLLGATRLPAVGPHPQWLTIFTSMFMHAGLLHIAGNMLYLWIFGNNVEDALGHVRFLGFYIACGVLAALAHIAINLHPPGTFIPTVGASGAIAGVLGAYLYLYPGNRVRTLVYLGFFYTLAEIPAILVLGVWFVTQFLGLGSMHGGIAYGAHVGGFIAGLIGIALLGGRSLRRPRARYNRSFDRYTGRGW